MSQGQQETPVARRGRHAGGKREAGQPIFVDRTGRRRRWTVLVGSSVAAGLLVSLALIAVGLFTGGSVSVPGWPSDDSGQQARPGTQVEPRDVPEAASTSRNSAGVDTNTAATSSHATTPGRATHPTEQPPASPTNPRPSGAGRPDEPGQGGEHRNSAPGRASKSPGNPR